ncbi:E3 ubiquitin-protein ligase hrd1 [Penicillium capsulatum]|uniref:RING-type E3 ubiquitin transferase n=1 Tax=Penicillium capsulatum TaxID=69766 RepID=A0A9W9HUE8_9EURO|nr:E3 ubiquitin-protein ligase hrd1 [Penicillium capsulatum]KAJ6106775.1 E3 ubiquitin-protein ligase hrd1 [Penicillium capsulatum]
MRLAAYAGASVALATGVFLKAVHQRANFYAACVYLSQSSANLMILMNLCLLVAGFLLFWVQRLLYGPLRPIETEQLYERAWFAVTETCLAMTIFRGELGGWFLVMFVSLLVGKVWGWIGEGRVEYLEQQPPANPRLFHIRLAASLVLSVLFNAFMLRYCINTVVHQARPDMMVMFGFEFAILTILSTSTTARYGIALVEIYITRQQIKTKMEERRSEIRAARDEAIREHARRGESSLPTDLPNENDVNELEIDVPGWEEKGRWVFYLDLLTDFVKLIVYLVFFAILLAFYGLPIHILRDVVVTIRSFGRRIMDFLRYRNATRDMNERYPDATAEEVAQEEVCIICREEMTPAQPTPGAPAEGETPPAAGARPVPDRLRPKKLPCGHILHFACLRSWLERQQNCPTCRRPVIGPASVRGAGAGGNNAAGNGVGGAQPNGAGNQAPGQPGAQDEGAPRARVYQFGPFRIGFGAVRGDLFQNLHQQIHQGNAPPQPAVNANPQGARQIGLGFGFGRRPPVPVPAHGAVPAAPGQPTGRSISTDVHTQLSHIEQQITQEIASLRAASEQLDRVRSFYTELNRLRSRQVNNAGQSTASSSGARVSSGTSSATPRRQFVPALGTPPMASGDPRLPEGLNLPAGWTLVPLQATNHQLGSSTHGVAPTPTTSDLSPTPTQNLSPAPASHVSPTRNTSEQGIQSGEGMILTNAATTDTPTLVANPMPSLNASVMPSSTESHPESPSQEWTDVQSDQISDAGPSGLPSWGSSARVTQDTGEADSSTAETQTKGKGRAATVEEAVDEQAES